MHDVPDISSLAVVIIGRNEGEHLARAIASIGADAAPIVYADSASSDDSVAIVRRRYAHVHVVELDRSRPLTPARGRNAGWDALMRLAPDVELVMFLDGDCELAPSWLREASAYMREHPKVGIACGRLRERERERNAYHRLADMEWAQPPGDIDDPGGIMMVRAQAWRDAGGQNADMPAAEEHEFCRRVIAAGWRVVRLPGDMAWHDIDMQRFAQWWTRMSRMGHSRAQGLWVHRDRYHLRQVLSIAAWGVALPVAIGAAAIPTLGLSLWLSLAYGRLWRKVAADRRARGDSDADARLYATATVAAKFAATTGLARFVLRTLPSGHGGRR